MSEEMKEIKVPAPTLTLDPFPEEAEAMQEAASSLRIPDPRRQRSRKLR